MVLILYLPDFDLAAVVLTKFIISIAFSFWLAIRIGEQYLKHEIKALLPSLK
jgi:hypothetical protein